MRTILLLAFVAGSPVAAALAQGTGRIDGLASISTRLTNPRQRVRVYAEPGSAPSAPPPAEHPFAGVVIALEGTPVLRAVAREPQTASMAQRAEHFVPHVLAIAAGSAVDFPNEDPIYHNVFSHSSARSYDLGRYARGEHKSVRFNRAGVVQVFCHIHADMSAYVLVYDHPFYVMPDSTGRFRLDNVPPGDYFLVAWHERVRPIRVAVRVEAGRTAQPRIAIPLTDPPAAP